MIDALRPYAEMKRTGLPWLGEVPTSWEIHRAKYSFREADDRSVQGDEELLSVSHKTGVTPRSQKNITMFMAESYEGHKVCHPGDIVVNTMWAWMAALGVSRHIGIVSPAYGVYRRRSTSQFEPKYLDYLLRTEAYRAEYLRSSKGVTTSRLRLYPPDFLRIPIVQPPLDEQRLIVRFLDWHGAQTAKLIRAKKKLIALLNEQKQAIIHRAVTRGLNPNVKLKPSGVPWLGDVPERWGIRKVREIARVVNGYPFDAALFTAGEGHSLIRIRDLNKTETVTRFAGDYVAAASVYPGETLIGMDGDFNVGTWNGDVPALLNQRMCCVRCNNSSLNAFVRLALARPLKEINTVTYSTTVKHLSSGQIERIQLAIPPADDLAAIIEHVQREVGGIDAISGSVRSELALVQEFRTRLIADVVTGKLDVRAAAASLADVTELEPIDEPTDNEDLDETMEAPETEDVTA